MPTSLSLSKLVDLALGTPEVGAVNFNVLHTLLHAMIARLNLGDVKADINDSDRDFLSTHKVQRMITGLSDIDSGKGEDSEDGFSETRDASEADTPASSASYKPKRQVPYHHLELRVEKLAEMLDNLNSLPSNTDLFERAKAKGDGERPVSDMWQYMQMKKRVDANEEGVGKLMSLIEDVMKEMQILRNANAALQDANAALQDANNSIQERVNNLNFDELNKKLADLENLTNELKNKFSSLPLPEDFAQFVTWPLLEDALKGVKTDLEGLNEAQAEPKKSVSRPASGRPMSAVSTASSGPTNELLDVLERLGKLSDSHQALKKRVDELEAQLKNKADKDTLENLMKQLERLRKQMDEQKAVVIRQVVSTRSPTPPKVVSPEPQIIPEPIKSPDRPAKVMSPKRVMSPEVVKSPEQVKSPEPVMSPPTVKSPDPIKSSELVASPEPVKSPEAIENLPQPLQDMTSFVFIPESQSKQETEPEGNLTAYSEIEAKPEHQPVETTSIPPFAPPKPVVIKQIERVVVHSPGLDLSGDLLDQLNKLKEDLELLKTMKDEMLGTKAPRKQKKKPSSGSVRKFVDKNGAKALDQLEDMALLPSSVAVQQYMAETGTSPADAIQQLLDMAELPTSEAIKQFASKTGTSPEAAAWQWNNLEPGLASVKQFVSDTGTSPQTAIQELMDISQLPSSDTVEQYMTKTGKSAADAVEDLMGLAQMPISDAIECYKSRTGISTPEAMKQIVDLVTVSTGEMKNKSPEGPIQHYMSKTGASPLEAILELMDMTQKPDTDPVQQYMTKTGMQDSSPAEAAQQLEDFLGIPCLEALRQYMSQTGTPAAESLQKLMEMAQMPTADAIEEYMSKTGSSADEAAQHLQALTEVPVFDAVKQYMAATGSSAPEAIKKLINMSHLPMADAVEQYKSETGASAEEAAQQIKKITQMPSSDCVPEAVQQLMELTSMQSSDPVQEYMSRTHLSAPDAIQELLSMTQLPSSKAVHQYMSKTGVSSLEAIEQLKDVTKMPSSAAVQQYISDTGENPSDAVHQLMSLTRMPSSQAVSLYISRTKPDTSDSVKKPPVHGGAEKLQSRSSQELLDILRTRVSDSESFEELVIRLGKLENTMKALQDAILNPPSLEESGFISEPVTDIQSFLTDMEEKIELLSSTSSTVTEQGESDTHARRKSRSKKKQSIFEEKDKSFEKCFGQMFESDSMEEEEMDAEAANLVSRELTRTNEKLKRLGSMLDHQMGELKEKVLGLDLELKRMAKGVEFALMRSKVAGVSTMSAANTRQSEEVVRTITVEVPSEESIQQKIDSDALSRAQQAILALQAELENLQKTTQSIIAENSQRSKQIENLLGYCDTLQEKKADKDYVAMEVDVKADKRQLDVKVNHSLFDTTTNEINKLIKDILAKLDGSENSWKDAYKALADDLEGKLDRLELDPLKEWLESRLKALNKKIMANANADWTEDDAAGLRKQLLQRFNCLSCDRPVDLLPTGPVPSLPSQNGLPPTRSPRPYTTFELDQIRQHAKSGLLSNNIVNYERAVITKELARLRGSDLKAFLVHFGQDMEALTRRQQSQPPAFINQDVSDYYATSRQCGGNHTLTFPHKRVSRMTQINNLFKEEIVETPPPAVFPLYKEEVDVQGVDGHIYRGRIERVQIEAKMPSKMTKPRPEQPPMSPSGPRPGRKIQYVDQDQTRTQTPPPINPKTRPMSALGSSPRPGSGRPSSRPQSTRPMSARLSGQESSRTTPYQDEPNIPQDSAGADPDATVVDSEAIRVSVPTPDVTEETSEQQESAP